MKNERYTTWLYRILALILAILLFSYVNSTKSSSNNQSSSTGSTTSLTATKTMTVSVPLQLNVNSNKYFVTGYPQKVKVTLKGPLALVTTTANTQNFKVYAALSDLGVGKHKVTLHQEGLNHEIESTIKPEKITVDIEPRRTVSFSVKVRYNSQNIAAGYSAGKATSDTTTVKATGAANEISRVKQVVAQLTVPANTKKTISSQAVIEAIDRSGKTVNVILTPSTTTVNLPITSDGQSKKVGVNLNAKNGSSGTTYKLSSDTTKVTAYGSATQLKKLSKVDVDVDVSDVKSQATKTVTLDTSDNNVTAFDPTTIKVTVKATTK
ncbi:CdaR family protein [Levilactobacillus brevis]|uniref:CdaR family protein n=1 Tax=Levilactobacillus brevis TaxID=1580 RepID=UPI001C1EF0A1|nr:CdaR family protein [Levilactobacillus brevis]MBU7559035.1 cell surface protein [Levilactobacillus brevis]MCE6010589.1 cell surface protein [Levilactobacillus brevis]MCE6013541.1 cell surface protein [Levilactobacillus brevis]MCE6015920.1 cell surface protein [Levilactobacillus brevis]MCE6018330.1 cell surface protein [Levilactobacillus brevis]